MFIDRKIRIAMIVGGMTVQGIVFAKLLDDHMKLGDQARYLIDVLAENNIQLTEFDMIAMRELGFKFREQA